MTVTEESLTVTEESLAEPSLDLPGSLHTTLPPSLSPLLHWGELSTQIDCCARHTPPGSLSIYSHRHTPL